MRISELSYTTLRWLLIPVVALHNAEEWLTFPIFGEVAVNVAARFGLSVAEPPWATLQAGLAVATAVPALVVAYAALRPSPRSDAAVAFVVSIFVVNAFLPHLPAAVLAGGYAPGVITALCVNLPYGALYFRRGMREGVLTGRTVVRALAAATAAIVLAGGLALGVLLR